jgi:hypothetical protein
MQTVRQSRPPWSSRPRWTCSPRATDPFLSLCSENFRRQAGWMTVQQTRGLQPQIWLVLWPFFVLAYSRSSVLLEVAPDNTTTKVSLAWPSKALNRLKETPGT